MKKLLVTGASGLLGLNLALEASSNYAVYGVVNSHRFHSPDFTVLDVNLLAPEVVGRVYDESQPDWVIHCAALTDLDACATNPQLAKELNTNLPRRMAAEAAKRGALFLHISTDAVYDGQKGDYVEKNATNPLSIYARSKLAGERAVANSYPESIIARVNMFGWSLTGEKSLAEFFFNNLRSRNPVKGFNDVFFSPLLVNNLGKILLRMLEEKLTGLYHVFSSDAISKYDFGVAIANRFGFDSNLISPISIKESGLIVARSPNLTMRTDKLAQALGEPTPTIAEGLDRFHQLYEQGYAKKLQTLMATVG